MKSLVIPLLALCVSAPAVETSLIQLQQAGAATVTIDPALGTISLYLVQDGKLNKRPASANFLTDLHADLKLIQRMPEPKRDGARETPFSMLEFGSADNVPLPWQVIDKLAEADRPKKGDTDTLSLVERARNTEAEFWGKVWAKDEPYDGVISAALGQRYLVIVVPSVHSFLIYEIQGELIIPKGWRNWGPELYIPQVWNSSPTPDELFRQLPADVKAERAEALKAQVDQLGQGAQKTIPLQNSEVWVAAGAQDRFVIVDFPNKHIMSYQYGGKTLELRSVRNLEVDLMIPSGFNTTPDSRQIFDEFARDKARKDFLASLGIASLDVDILKALVGGRQVKGGQKVSPIQAATVAGSQTFDLIIDFTQQQKILAYRAVGLSNGLQFTSMRDYTIDSALAQLDNMRSEKAYAAQMLASAKGQLNNHRADLAWLTVQTALKLDPALYKQVEKTPDMTREFSKNADYAQVIKTATDAAAREAAAIETIKKNAEDAKTKKKEKAAGK